MVRRLITRMIEDVIAETGAARRRRSSRARPPTCATPARPLVAFSPAMEKADAAIKGFLYPRMYRHARVMRVMGEAEGVVRDLFAHYVGDAGRPAGGMGAKGSTRADEGARARRIADYIAGMTDRYALIEHAKYFKATPELR